MADSTPKSYHTDPTLYLYTSLTAGSSHIITATSRLETILKANKIPFLALDVATDEKARMLWGRRAGKRKLPGLVRLGMVVGDLEEVEEWNEYGELKENIGSGIAAPSTPSVPSTPSKASSSVHPPSKDLSSVQTPTKPSQPPQPSETESPLTTAMRQAGQAAAKKANNSKAAKAKALEDPEATDSAKLDGDDGFTSTKITAETDLSMNPESASPIIHKEGDIPEEGDVGNEISEEGLDTPTTTEGLHTLSSTRATESELKQFGQKEHAVKFKIPQRAGPELKNSKNSSSDASASIDEPNDQAAKENEQPHQNSDSYTNESNPEPNTSGHGTDNTQKQNNTGEIELKKDDKRTPLEPTMSTEDEHTIEPKSSEAGDNNMEHDNDKEAGTQNQIPENPSLKSTALEAKPSEVNKDPVLAAIERGKTGGPLLDHRQLKPNVLTKNDEMADKPPGKTTQDQPAGSAPEADESVGD